MAVYRTFLYKECIELRANKKLWLFSFILLVYPLLVNIIGRHPIMPMEYIMTIMLAVAATCSGEFVFFSLLEEFRCDTFNILLVSPINKKFLFLYKAAIPVLVCVLCSFLGLLINDLVIEMFPTFHSFENAFSIFNVLVVVFAAISSAAVEFCFAVKDQAPDKKKHTLSIFFSTLIGVMLIFAGKIYHFLFFLIPAGLILSFLIYLCLYLLKYSTANVKIKKQYIDFFRGRNLTLAKAFIVKSLQWIKISVWLELGVFLIASILTSSKILFFYAFLFLLSSFGARRILFPLLANDSINRSTETIFVVCRKFSYYLYSTLPSFIISIVSSCIIVLLFSHLPFSDLILVALTSIFSCLYACTIHHFIIKKSSDFTLGSFILSILSIGTYLGLFIIFHQIFNSLPIAIS